MLVGFPVGRRAKLVDDVLFSLGRVRRAPTPQWLQEHRDQEQYPDEATLTAALPPGWRIAERSGSGNVLSQTLLVWAEGTPKVHLIPQRLERRWRARGVPAVLDRGPTYRTIFRLERAVGD